MSGLGSDGGAGESAENVSGGITTLYTGFETSGAAGAAASCFGGETTGCDSLACAGTLNSIGGGAGGGLLFAASGEGAGASAITGGAVRPASGIF